MIAPQQQHIWHPSFLATVSLVSTAPSSSAWYILHISLKALIMKRASSRLLPPALACTAAVTTLPSLYHNHPDCIGPWCPHPEGNQVHWRCDGCQAIAPDGNRVAEAAIAENLRHTTRRLLQGARKWLTLDDEELGRS